MCVMSVRWVTRSCEMLQKMQDPGLVKLFGTPAQLSEVLGTRIGVCGPNILGSSITLTLQRNGRGGWLSPNSSTTLHFTLP
jgi:hypothetical protein